MTIEKVETGENGNLNIGIRCPMCHELKTIKNVKTEEFADYTLNYRKGKNKLIQSIFPNMDIHEREMFISGICPECWTKLFSEDD